MSAMREAVENYMERLMNKAMYDALELNDYVPLPPDGVIEELKAILNDPDPDLLTTREQIDALTDPETTIIGSSHLPESHPGTVYRRVRDETVEDAGSVWYDFGNDYDVPSTDIMLPARVIFRPGVVQV